MSVLSFERFFKFLKIYIKLIGIIMIIIIIRYFFVSFFECM